jgi:hypothetical protein
MLHPVTEKTFKQLMNSPWFANVGKPMVLPNANAANWVIPCETWEQAVEHGSSLEWENIRLEAQNRLRANLISIDPALFSVWNDKTALIRPMAIQLTDQIVEQHVPSEFRKSLTADLRWDILGVLMESEYSDSVKPFFYANLAYWYTVGRYPCGQIGDSSNPKLLVF